MRILYVCHRFPYPPNRGGKIRPFYMIKHLSERHEVVVASLARSVQEAEEGRGLQEHCHEAIMERVTAPMALLRMILRLPTTVPSSMGYFYSPRLAEAIRRKLSGERFDLIFVHCSSVAQYVADVRGIPKILDFGDMDSQKWLAYAGARRFPMSLGYWLEGTKLQREEIRLAGKFDLCTATTPGECETLESFDTGTPAAWFPNGVNTDYFKPSDAPYDEDLISFVGRMDYFPNSGGIIDFCRDTYPLIRKKRPQTKLVIVGANPPRQVLELAEIDGVTVTGSVPDVRPWVQKSAVSVAPLSIARGTQNKILESLAMGIPTVSSVPAAKGIDAVGGEHFLVAATPSEFADAVVDLLDHPDKRRGLAEAGRERMLSNHSWTHSMQRLDELIERCVGEHERVAAEAR